MYYRNGIKDLYKTLEIEEFEGKLKVLVYPDHLEGIIDVSELDEIILTLDKQSNTIKHTQEEVQNIKKTYTKGTKVQLIKMYDLTNSVLSGTMGIIDFVDDVGTIHVNWETGSTLGLVVGIDEFKVFREGK
ncbi:MAG: DUF4314 domain-containing protein [Clostridia bacterium]|nr:DUF4314 domain-containing protein [Clostridia bacterium]